MAGVPVAVLVILEEGQIFMEDMVPAVGRVYSWESVWLLMA